MDDSEEIKYCVSCGAPLPPGEWYKCDICQQIDLELIDPEDGPYGPESPNW